MGKILDVTTEEQTKDAYGGDVIRKVISKMQEVE